LHKLQHQIHEKKKRSDAMPKVKFYPSTSTAAARATMIRTTTTTTTTTTQVPKLLHSTINTAISEKITNNSTITHHKTNNSSTINPVYEYSEEINAAAERDFHVRREQLAETCNKFNIVNKYPPNAWEFFISQGHGLAWCNVFKAASSTWMYYFNLLGNYSTILITLH
jgi:hypothetical protein